uniref:LIM zinc-binding domain-containing protein n=1 Tax=Steinernema glaseri TaxID=37863 RepID=A0A1I7ZQ79_9BILA
MSDNEDPYAISSDSEDEEALKKPPPKINIEGRTVADIKQLKDALAEQKEVTVDDNRREELEALKAKKEELLKMKKEFEEGKVAQEIDPEKKAQIEEERKELQAATKENYSKFKDRFEKMDETLEMNLEEKLKSMEKQLEGVGKETLASVKGRFENPQEEVTVERQELPDYQRSEAEKKRILSTFSQKEMTADEAPKECAICGKTVYPVERIFANKQLYHNNCFKCHKCAKRLTATNYNSHEGKLLCKVHMIEVFHPEIAQSMNPETTEEDEHGGAAGEDDDEFAVSSKPKQLSSDVVRSGTKVQDDLSAIGSLKDRKGDWESSVNEAMTVEKKTVIEEEIASGKVKANLDRFVSGAANAEEPEEEEDDANRDPNIIREDKKKRREELDFKQVGDIKNKWKTGEVEGAEVKEGAAKADLEELKQGVKVRERFQERTTAEIENVEKSYDSSLLDTSAVAEARKSFLEGKAYEGAAVEKTAVEDIKFSELASFKERFEKGDQSGPVEKTAVDVEVQLGNIKAQFEKGEDDMSPEERAELKKKEIEAEFLRYKLARKLQAKKAKEEAGEVVEGAEEGEVIEGAEVGSIKDRFEKGQASNVSEGGKSQLDIEFKMAGKARDKFKEIDASGAAPVAPNLQKTEVRKYDTRKDVNVPEPINRRVVDDDEEPEDEDFDVKNLMNKFKNIGEQGNVQKERKLEDLEGVKLESKSLKQRFEQAGQEAEDAEAAEMKKKILEEEFKRLKEEKEKAKEVEPEEEEDAEMPTKEEIQVAAEHASKMAAKWEKIQKREAKRAQKGQMPAKTTKDE